jgi:hypothetical protein
MKKLLSVLAAFLIAALGIPANATITNSSAYTRYPSSGASVDLYSGLVVATGQDTTGGTYLSPAISNVNGDIRSIGAGVIATNAAGTSPTLIVALYASMTQGGSYFPVKVKQAGTDYSVLSPTLDISTALSSPTQAGFDTNNYGVTQFAYPYYKIGAVLGGTGTPGWSGIVYAAVKRQTTK